MKPNTKKKNVEILNATSATDATPPLETTIIVLLDKSGSMGREREIAMVTVNEFIQLQKDQPGSAEISIYLFNEEITAFCKGVPVRDAPPLAKESYVPGGQTALLDAIGRSIQDTSAQTENKCVIVAVLTDGKENASTRCTLDEIKNLIQEKEALGWDFIYLSADLDAISSARAMGIRQEHVHVFDKTADGFASSRKKMSDAVDEKRRHGTITGVQHEHSDPRARVMPGGRRQRRSNVEEDCGSLSGEGEGCTPVNRSPRWRIPFGSEDSPGRDGQRNLRGRGIQLGQIQFWRQLILRHPEKGARLHAHCFPNSTNLLIAEGSVPGTALVYSIYPRSAIVSFRVARDNEGMMNPLYERLMGERERITEVFGADLEFYEGKKKKYDYIRLVLRNGGFKNQQQWRTIQGEMIETMERLNSAIAAVM